MVLPPSEQGSSPNGQGLAREPGSGVPVDLTPGGDADRFLVAFAYFLASVPLFALLLFLFNREQGYRRFHAQQALAFAVVILVVEVAVGIVLGVGDGSRAGLAALPFEFWYGYKAYAADGPFAIPLVTTLARRLFPGFPSAAEIGSAPGQ